MFKNILIALTTLALLAIAIRVWIGPVLVQEIHYHYGPEFNADKIDYKNTDLREDNMKTLRYKVPEVGK